MEAMQAVQMASVLNATRLRKARDLLLSGEPRRCKRT
jgi:hypothetical protein